MRSNIIFLSFAALFCLSVLTVGCVLLISEINLHIEATMLPQKSWHQKILKSDGDQCRDERQEP